MTVVVRWKGRATQGLEPLVSNWIQSPLILCIGGFDTKASLGSWEDVQLCLSEFYRLSMEIAYEQNVPLAQVDVVFETICGYELLLLPQIQTCLDVHSEDVDAANVKRIAMGLHPIQFHPFSLQESLPCSSSRLDPLKMYHHVAVGGTFDYLHAGHKILLSMASWITLDSLTVGVMDLPKEQWHHKKAFEWMQPIEKRIQQVEAFLNLFQRGLKYQVIPIHDPFGPTRTDRNLNALVGSQETFKGCQAGDFSRDLFQVNQERTSLGLSPLEILMIHVISPQESIVDEDKMNLKISSSYLREWISNQK